MKDTVNQFKHIKDFYPAVLSTLNQLGGRAHLTEIYDAFLARYRGVLDDSFFSETKDNDVKWRDYINRAGYWLRTNGFIKPSIGRRAIWELTGKEFRQE